MASRGWQGNPPRSEEDARVRIVDAAARCVDRYGTTKTTLSDVAADLGVTRQTVYRYFPRFTDMLVAVAEAGAADFVERMITDLKGVTDPAEAAARALVFAVTTIPTEPRLGVLLQVGETDVFARGAISDAAFSYGAAILRRFDVDWAAAKVTDADLESLAEIIMRLLVSFLQSPLLPPRSDGDLRAMVHRWLAPAFALAASEPTGRRRRLTRVS